jgi:hypothetical protein
LCSGGCGYPEFAQRRKRNSVRYPSI